MFSVRLSVCLVIGDSSFPLHNLTASHLTFSRVVQLHVLADEAGIASDLRRQELALNAANAVLIGLEAGSKLLDQDSPGAPPATGCSSLMIVIYDRYAEFLVRLGVRPGRAHPSLSHLLATVLSANHHALTKPEGAA